MKMHILYVETTGEIGGAEVSLLNLLKHIDQYQPIVVAPKKGPLVAKLQNMKIPVYILPMPQASRRNSIPWVWSVLRLARLCRRLGVSLVHANHEFANRHAWAAAQLARVPYICHVRNLQTEYSFRDYWLGLPKMLIANSETTAQSFARQLRKSQRSLVIYNGVDLYHFNGRRVSDETMSFSPIKFVIAQVGRLVPEKGVHIFIRAIAIVAARYPFVKAVVAGDAAVDGNKVYALKLKQVVSQLGLECNLTFLGYVDDIRKLYGVVDLIVQSSAVEPFGRTLIEAMAMRVPVIATDVGGPKEIIENGVSGLLIPPNDPQALAKAIERVIEDKSLAVKLAENGRTRVEAHFPLERHVRQVQDLYDHMLA